MRRGIVLVAAALVVGCSSSSGGGGGDGGGGGGGGAGASCTGPTSPNACLGAGHDNCNPCTKITNAQATAAVGGATLSPGMQGASQCEWVENDMNGNPSLIVDFHVGTDPRLFACDPANGFQFTAVSGVGDSACYIQQPLAYPPHTVWQLEFIKGCAVYDTTVSPGPNGPPLSDAQEQSEEKALALDAVPNL